MKHRVWVCYFERITGLLERLDYAKMVDGLSPGKASNQPINHSHHTQHTIQPMPNPNPLRLATLTQLREQARPQITLAEMARACGLSGNTSRLTVGAWEHGTAIPRANRRPHLLRYLWDTLQLRRDPAEFERIWNILVEEWEWEPISDREWQLLTNAPRPTLSPITSTPPAVVPFQAPALTPHFVGREIEFTQLETLLLNPLPPRIVALVGMGGIGKTTLAISLAYRLRSSFSDGVLWANVANSEPLDILQSWALAFGYDFSTQHSLESRAAAMRMLFSTKRVLIILDDIRRLDGVRALLPGTDQCTVLLTSRDQAIAIALNATVQPLEELQIADSMQLLQNIVGIERIDVDRVHAEAICQRLQFLPLAIEIIAKQILRNRQQSLETVLLRLQDAQRRLDQLEFKDLSVRASFALSWEMLGQELRRAFTLLGIFQGRSFSTALFTPLMTLDTTVAEEYLTELVALSLLSIEANGRYRQHPLLADFALEQLHDRTESYDRFAIACLRFCRPSGTPLVMLEAEIENVMTAMQAMFHLGKWAMVIDFADGLEEFWFQKGRYSEARQGLTLAIQAATQLNWPERRAKLLLACGFVCYELREMVAAEELFIVVLELAKTLQLSLLMADATCHLARIAIERGDYEAVDEFLSQCEAVYHANHHQKGIAQSKQLRGVLSLRNDDKENAERLCLEALAIFEQLQDIPGILSALRTLAENESEKTPQPTTNLYAESFLRLAEQHDRQSELAEAYFAKAVSLRHQQQFTQAISYAKRAEELARFMGVVSLLSFTIYEQGVIYRLTGEYQDAFTVGQICRQMMQTANDGFNLVYCLSHLGKTHRLLGQRNEALSCWQEALELAVSLRHPLTENLQQLIAELHPHPLLT